MANGQTRKGRGKGPFTCPECEHTGQHAEFPTYQARFQHRLKAHGVEPKAKGQYQRVQQRKKRKQQKEREPHPHEHEHTTQFGAESPVSRDQADFENAVNRCAGRCQAIVEAFAAEFGIPKALLATGVAEVLHPSGRRAVHGPEVRMPALPRTSAA